MPGAAAVPLGAVRVCAVLDQDDPLAPAELGDLVGLEGEVAADVDEEDRARLVLAHLALEIFERHAKVVAVAVDELDVRAPALIAASGVAMNVFDGQRTVSPRTPAHSSAASAAPVQPLNATASSRFQVDHSPLELGGQLTLGPALGVEHAIPELVERARSRWSKPIAKRASSVERSGANIAPYPISGACGPPPKLNEL